jgi:hypothetical protein
MDNQRTIIGRFFRDRWDAASAAALLFFVLYLLALYLSGLFIDWEELTLEPFFILRGMRLYSDIATHHTPLLTGFMVVLYRLTGIHIVVRQVVLLAVSVATAFLMLRAVRRLAGKRAAFFSLILFSIFWPFYGGLDFWFDTFLPLFFLAAFLLVIGRDSPRRLALAGIFLGVSFLVKPNGGQVALVIFILLLVRAKPWTRRLQDAALYSAGVALPVLLAAAWYAVHGRLGDAFYWVFTYNLSGAYTRHGLLPPSLSDAVRLLVVIGPILVLLTISLFSAAVRRKISWEFRLAFYMGFIASLALIPRWERFHIAPALPFLVICLVLSFQRILNISREAKAGRWKKAAVLFSTAWTLAVVLDIGTYYPPILADKIIPRFSRFWPLHSYDAPAWFDESARRYMRDIPVIGKYLRETTSEGDKIFVWGWQGSRIYLESGRLPSGKFYYTLPWFTGLPQFRRDLMTSLTRGRPRYIVVLKKPYPGTPALEDLGIDLSKLGYVMRPELEARFPEVVFWTSSGSGPR